MEKLELVGPPGCGLGLQEIGENGLCVGPNVTHHVVICSGLLIARDEARVGPLDEHVRILSSSCRGVVVEVDDQRRILGLGRV